MARPLLKIDDTQLTALMRLKPSLADTAAFFSCSEDTIERYLRRTHKVGFADFREQNMVHTRFSLVRKALEKAQAGDNVMLIFALKNLCGWQDKPEIPPLAEEPLNLKLAYGCGCTSKN